MPRAMSTKLSRPESQPYQSPSPSPTLTAPASTASSGSKKRHVCPTCDRAFTTSGHLARHNRVHTGERNHKCPFPGCETRCSRQDNLQQHYRIHLAPGSRRNNRAGLSRSSTSKRAPSPPPAPPALEPARLYSQPSHSPPPDSPPPLTQATLPATATLRSSDSASPELQYNLPNSYSFRPSSSYQEYPQTYAISPPVPTSSRHSISHISPPSPDSVSSGPSTPAPPYVYDNEYRNGYESPPPVLAPINVTRTGRELGSAIGLNGGGIGVERHYIHQPQPYYQQAQEGQAEVSLGHGAWKGNVKGGLVQ
ncbi:hypothetical protein DFS33DRAFT_1343514 [Desarmillaria ectypa]|nr:hypothetical protein DFS33DRAFT_1343514 [Desarmillaria ectypa]